MTTNYQDRGYSNNSQGDARGIAHMIRRKIKTPMAIKRALKILFIPKTPRFTSPQEAGETPVGVFSQGDQSTSSSQIENSCKISRPVPSSLIIPIRPSPRPFPKNSRKTMR